VSIARPSGRATAFRAGGELLRLREVIVGEHAGDDAIERARKVLRDAGYRDEEMPPIRRATAPP